MSTITLPNIRVSSDLTVKVRLKDSGVAIDWSTLTKIKASIYSDAQRALAGRCDVSIDAEDSTLLVCSYAANKPQYVGVNRIVVSAKYMGETKTYDKPAFTFVRWTADQEGEQITIDDPDVDVEIDVEDISSSILQEAVDAAFEAADRANDAAAAAEHMVDIHTGPEGKSAYEVAVEEGYTGTEDEWLASLKGPVGETPDISIGTVTTVEPGTPAAASMTGTPEAPVLNLSIPKGLVGATPNFTVGTVTTGEPGSSVIVTITGTPEAPVLNLTIPQGMQGNTGSSVEYPYELVNNLTTNDATKGLSAAQGVVLDGKVSQLEAKVNEFFTGVEVDGNAEEFADGSVIFNNGTLSASTNGKVYKISVDKGDFLRVSSVLGASYGVIARETDVSGQYDAMFQGTGSNDSPIDYICEKAEDLYISINSSYAYQIIHIKNDQIEALLDSPWVESFDDVTALAGILGLTYIKYSDGSKTATGSTINTYVLPCAGFTKIRVFVSARDTVPAAIAFFSDVENIGSGTYISGVQMQANYYGGRWYEAEVPATAKCVCVCNHLGSVSEPVIKVNIPVGLYTKKIYEFLGGIRMSFDYTGATVGSTYQVKKHYGLNIGTGETFKIYLSGNDDDENQTYFNFYNSQNVRIAQTKGAGYGNRIIQLTNTFGSTITMVECVVSKVNKTAIYDAIFLIGGNRDIALELDTLKDELSWLPNYLTVPYYYRDFLATKSASIRAAMLNAGKNGSTFVFITDVHWPNNEKHSPALIKHIVSELPIEDVFFGGDAFNGGDADTQVGYMQDFGKKMNEASPRFFAIRGNHENNLNDGGTGFAGDYFYTMLLKYADYNVVPGEYDNYYFDNETTKTRFIVLNTGQGGDHYTSEQSAWLSSILNDMGVDYHAIILLHIAYLTASDLESDTMAPTMLAAANVADSFNAQNNGKKVEAFICGHLHNDANKVTTGGIPIILTDCDARQSQSGNSQTVKTVNEQAFDVITIDYTGIITCVRIGRGNDRTITY